VLTVPIFRVREWVFEAKQAIAMSLIVVGAASLVGCERATGGRSRVDALASRFLLRSGSPWQRPFAGAASRKFVSGSTQLLLLALVMCCAAISMARESPVNAPDQMPVASMARPARLRRCA